VKPGEIARAVSRGAFYLAIERLVAVLSGIVYFALLLRWLGPTKYGIMTLAVSFAGLATVANGNFETYLERFAAEYLAHGRFATLRRAHLLAIAVKLGLGLLASALLFALAPWLARQFAMPELATLLPVLTALVITDGLASTARATLYGLQRFRWLSVLAVGFHVAKTVMVGALWWSREGLTGLAIGLAVLSVAQGAIVTVVPLLMLSKGRDPDGETTPGPRELLRTMTRYCLPLLGARVAFTSGQNLGKVVLGKLLDAEHLGYFSFAFQTVDRFVDVLYVLPNALLPSLTHLVARGERQRLDAVFAQSFRLIQVTAMTLGVGLVIFAPELTLLVGSPLFLPAVPVLRILALVPLARTAHQPLTMLFQAMRQPGIVLRLALLKFGVEFAGVFTLVPMLGVPGAGWANLAGAVAAFAGALLAARHLLPDGGFGRARAVRRSLLLAAVSIALALGAERVMPGMAGLAVRIAITAAMLLGVLRLGLVTSADLDKLGALPLGAEWLRSGRAAMLGAVTRVARAVEPRRAT
jgi:O-antigen/teichoic acid export membrane protein